MASCITSQWSNTYSPQARLTVDAVNANSTLANLNWKLEYVGHGYPPHTTGGRAYSVVVAGETVSSGSYDINGKTGTYTIASGTKRVSRTKSNQTVSFSLSFAFNLTWSGVYSGTRSASGTVTVQARSSNTYSFNANGGTGAPSSATKWGGEDFTFPTGKPNRTGYAFAGWYNTSINNGTVYQPGQTVHDLPDQAVTWLAKWTANAFTVKYDANGGTGAPGNQTKTYGVTLKLSTTVPTRENCIFLGWGTAPGSTTVAYAAGANYTANADLTLYAMWRRAYNPPVIENVKIDRSTSLGTITDKGDMAAVSFDWRLDENSGGLESIKVGYRREGGSWFDSTVTASGMSGHVEKKTVGLMLSTENSYEIRILVTDNKGSTEYIGTLPATKYIIDFSPEGGIGFGKPAPDDQTIRCYKDFYHESPVYVVGGQSIYFEDSDGEYSIRLVRGSQPGMLTTNLDRWDINGDLYIDNVHLRNNMALMGQLTSGSYSAIVKLNSSDQVELNWTSGGLKGRVRKQLWSGTWSSGSLTLAEVPFYNMFLISFSGGTDDTTEDGYLIANRDATGKRISGIGAVIGGTGNSPRIVCCDITVDGTKLTYSGLTMTAITSSIGSFKTARKIRRIVGLF